MIVKAFGGKALVRRVWAVDANAVYVTDDAQFQRLTAGEEGIRPMVGFPPEDVFMYDPAVVVSLGRSDKEKLDWSKLTTWRDEGSHQGK